jgi:hypothetical protein
MSLKRHFSLLLAILALAHPAFAQHHTPNRGGHPAGAGGHPAQQRAMPGVGQHPMTSQQHEHVMFQQMIIQQMMFESIMNSRIAATRRQGPPSQNGGGQQPSSNSRSKSNAGRQQNGSNSTQPRNNQAHPGVKPQSEKKAESPGNVSKPTKQERAKESKENEATGIHKRHELERSLYHPEKNAIVHNRGVQASDQSTISLLKTSEMKLRRADHDYAGHRVEAMRHVGHALNQLTGSYFFNDHIGSGAGNLPQAESDRLLREAEGHLRFVENTLRTRTNSLEHHHNARTSVAEAIRELRIALRIN